MTSSTLTKEKQLLVITEIQKYKKQVLLDILSHPPSIEKIVLFLEKEVPELLKNNSITTISKLELTYSKLLEVSKAYRFHASKSNLEELDKEKSIITEKLLKADPNSILPNKMVFHIKNMKFHNKKSKVYTDYINKIERSLFLRDKNMNYFVKHNMGLVYKIANRHRDRNVDFEDILQQGYIGLIHAIGLFDVKKGFKFSTYAVWWIKHKILRYCAEKKLSVKVPAHHQYTINHSKKILKKYLNQGNELNDEAYKKLFGNKSEKIKEMLKKEVVSSSFQSISHNKQKQKLFDYNIPQQLTENPDYDQIILNEEAHKKIMLEVNKLPYKMRYIILNNFGLKDSLEEEKSLTDIAKEYSVSRERIRQQKNKALEILKLSLGELRESL